MEHALTLPREPLLVVVLGPTASGKTGLALTIARHFDGERGQVKAKQRPGPFRSRAFYFTAALVARHAQWPLCVPRVSIAVANVIVMIPPKMFAVWSQLISHKTPESVSLHLSVYI